MKITDAFVTCILLLLFLCCLGCKQKISNSKSVVSTIIYTSKFGEDIEVQYNSDATVEVHFMQTEDVYLKAFLAQQTQSTSGVKYKSTDGRFVFWIQGTAASIYHKNELIFSGASIQN